MNRIRMFSIAIAILMVAGAFGTVAFSAASPTSAAQKIADPSKMEFSPEMRASTGNNVPTSEELASFSSGTAGSHEQSDYYTTGDYAYFYTFGYGKSNWMNSTKRGEGTYCEVWTVNDLTFPAGDPRNAYTSRITITDDMVQMAIDEFDNNIYATEAQYFGTPDPLNGTNSYWNYMGDTVNPAYYSRSLNTTDDGKVIIMIMNIVDDNFNDPYYPSYIVGFFSPTTESYYDRNIIHIDCWDWENRTTGTSARPYVYESTLAHEYQHLLHSDLDADEDSWINEGCSMYSEMLCGYGVPWSHIDYYLTTPSNSLTEWGDQGDINILADYGASALFTIYLNDHFGGAKFISTLAHDENNSIDGVNSALAKSGYHWTFDKVFRYWKIANLIHSNTPGSGWYNYKSLDLAANPLQIEPMYYWAGSGTVYRSDYFGDIVSRNGYNTGVNTLSSYGVDYIQVNGISSIPSRLQKLTFNGDDVAVKGWTVVDGTGIDGLSEGNAWYSGYGDLADFKLVGTLDLTGMDEATLAFDTWYDIEEFWDFGFVQVSTDGGESWASVANENTTDEFDPNGHPLIAENLPGLTGYNYGHQVFDLTDYVGGEVMVQFRYMTDWATSYEGWYLNNVTLNGVLVDNADDVTFLEPVYPDAGFKVTIYAPQSYYNGHILPMRLVDMPVKALTESGSVTLRTYANYPVIYLIVSATNGPVDYQFGTNMPAMIPL